MATYPPLRKTLERSGNSKLPEKIGNSEDEKAKRK